MKGKMKKLAALALAAIMVLAMGLTVSAAEGDMTITITNPQKVTENGVMKEATYTAYKIFTATTNGSYTAYRLDNTSAVYATLSGLMEGEEGGKTATEKQEEAGIELTATTADGQYNVKVTSAPKFAEYLKNLSWIGVSGYNGSLSEDGKSVVITIPAAAGIGYYFVNTNSGSLANLNTVTTNVDITDKNEKPEIEKTAPTVSEDSVEIGQKIPFIIKGTVPATLGYNKYDYVIADTMSAGLTFNDDIVVKVGETIVYQKGVGDTSAVTNENVKVEYNSNGKTFVITFDMTKFSQDTDVNVTYSATVNEGAINVDSVNNSATLTYSNDPNDSSKTQTTPPSKVTKYTSSIIIDKVDGSSTDENKPKLENAEFVLTKTETVNEVSVTKYYKYTEPKQATETAAAVEAKVEWVDNIKDATVVKTDSEGKANFDGLKDGTYELRETKAPAGYNLMEKAMSVTVKGSISNTDSQPIKVNQTPTVENFRGSVLPSTGGIGTTIFYVVGGILVIGAGILLITKKRMSKSN